MKKPIQSRLKRSVAFATLVLALIGAASPCSAESIMRMSLGASDGNMRFQNGMFSVLGDGVANSPGDRDASIDYVMSGTQAFSAFAPNGNPSVTLTGMMVAAPPANNNSFIVQAFDDGLLEIYGDDNTLLLSAELIASALQGALGPGDKQGLFLGFGDITGGTLLEELRLDPESLQLRIKFPKISNGFWVTGRQLDPFTSWTPSVEILASIIPEPAAFVQFCSLVGLLLSARRRRRR